MKINIQVFLLDFVNLKILIYAYFWFFYNKNLNIQRNKKANYTLFGDHQTSEWIKKTDNKFLSSPMNNDNTKLILRQNTASLNQPFYIK